MKLSFSPDLGHTTKARVAPIPSHIDRSSCIHTLLFKATFDSTQSYLRARSDRFRVELWTNLPVHGHARPGGEWRAVQFMEPEQVQGTSASTQSFSLLTDANADTNGKCEENTLYLRLRASLQDHIGAQFSYTFRLVHASGHVEWLGSHNNNGTIVVERGFPGVTLSKDWAVREDGAFALGETLAGKSLVRLNRPKEWLVWVWKPSASLPTQFAGTGPCEGGAMVLLPCQSTNIGDSLKPLVLVAGESSSLRLSTDGRITVDYVDSYITRQASLAALEHSQGLLGGAAALCSGVVLSFDLMAAVVATHLSSAAAPYHIVVLPISDAPEAQEIPLWKLQLPTSATSEGQRLVLYSPKLRKAKLLSAPLPSDGILRLGPFGGELLVSPVDIVCENNRTWQIILLTPSKEITVRTEQLPQILPTPPPSPYDSPSDCGATGLEVLGVHPSGVQPSLDDATPHVRSPTPSSSHGGPRQSTHGRRQSLSMVLVRSLPARLVRAYLHAIFNVILWFWNAFIRALAVRLIGEGIPQVITHLLSLALAKTATTWRSRGPGGAPAPTSSGEPSDASQVSESGPTGAPSAAATGDAESSCRGDESARDATPNGLEARVRPEVGSLIATPSSLSPSLSPQKREEASRVVVSAGLLQERSSPTVLIHGLSPLRNLCGTFDGRALPSPSVTSLEDGVCLVEFTEVDGEGELKVSFEL